MNDELNFSKLNSNFVSGSSEISVCVFYFNSIGILQILITDFPERIREKLECSKILNKCDDGVLKILIKFEEKNFCEFSVFISKSMVLKLQHTQIKINKTNGTLDIRYLTIKNLLNPEKILQTLEINLYNFSESFVEKNRLKDDDDEDNNLSYIDLKSSFKKIHSINCKNCSNSIIKGLETQNSKLAFNFNYDYIENLEMLSCHESDMNNVIPNLENELKKIINFTFFKAQIPIEIIHETLVKDSISNEQMGEISKKFYTFDLGLINFTTTKEERIIQLSIRSYIKTLIFHCVNENKKILSLLDASSKEKIDFIINSSFLHFSFKEVKLNERSSSDLNLINNFTNIIFSEVIYGDNFCQGSLEDQIVGVKFLHQDFKKELVEELRANKIKYEKQMTRFLKTSNYYETLSNLNSNSKESQEEKSCYIIELN